MSALGRRAESLRRIARTLRADPTSDPATMLAEAVRMLETSADDVRESLRSGDRAEACRRLMHGWMWFGQAVALNRVIHDLDDDEKIGRASNELRAVEREYHAARSRAEGR